MMQQPITIARPYAIALFKLAKETNTLEIWEQTLSVLISKEFLNYFFDKKDFINYSKLHKVSLFEEIQTYVKNFMELLQKNKRLIVFPYIVNQFNELVMEYQNNSNIIIESAFELNVQQRKNFIKFLEKKFNKKLSVQIKIVPELIGGIRAKVGNEVLDYSIKAQLSNMKANIIA